MTNWTLLNFTNYERTSCIKQLIKNMDNLYKLAEKGDTVAHSIYIDLDSAINGGIFTKKQAIYLCLWAKGYTQKDIGLMYRIKQETVSEVIANSVMRIKEYLKKTS